jgi:hypothetical protein
MKAAMNQQFQNHIHAFAKALELVCVVVVCVCAYTSIAV